MKRTYILLLVMVLLLAACGRQTQGADASQTPTWQEQYDLGVRYLSEGNYKEAIIAFTAAIEIDPMKPDAYLNKANAYIGMNDFDSACDILEKGYDMTKSQMLKDKLDEIESGTVLDYWGNVRMSSHFDESGNLQWYHIYGYNGKQTVSVTTYDPSGAQTAYWDGFLYNDQGQPTRWMIYADEDGHVIGYDDYSYDENGREISSESYSLDGTLEGRFEFTYAENGKTSFTYHYAPDGTATGHWEDVYDGDLHIATYNYDADGKLWGHMEFHYDKNGVLVEMIDYDADGNVLSSEVSTR